MGKKYDLEIEKSENRADVHRARYHASVMAVENLEAGQDFKELPDVYVIFVTENDLFGDGAAVHSFQNRDDATGNPLGDGAHILYVNGEYRGNDDLGRLMHDFNCSRAEDMYFRLMAEQTKYLKENPKGVEHMCNIMDDLRKESEERGRNEGKEAQARETAKKLYQRGNSPTDIADIVGYAVEKVEQWLGLVTV